LHRIPEALKLLPSCYSNDNYPRNPY